MWFDYLTLKGGVKVDLTSETEGLGSKRVEILTTLLQIRTSQPHS